MTPFIRFAAVVSPNGIIWEDEHLLTTDQRKFVRDVGATLKNQGLLLQANFAIAYWKNAEDFIGMAMEVEDADRARKEFEAIWFAVSNRFTTGRIYTHREITEIANPDLEGWQHDVNEQWIKNAWNSLKEGGPWAYKGAGVVFNKVEGGWIVV